MGKAGRTPSHRPMMRSRALCKLVLCAGMGVLIFALLWWASPGVRTERPEESAGSRVAALRQRADAGDNTARMDLSVLLAGSAEGQAHLASAAAAGHPPAITALAMDAIHSGRANDATARNRLEPLARQGYYPAITLLASCLSEGACGAGRTEDAYMWTLVSRRLFEQGKLATNDLATEEHRLRPAVDPLQAERAAQHARGIADRIDRVGL